MGLRISFVLLLFFLLLGIATPSFIDYDRLETSVVKGRSLLPNNGCPFDVKNINYTIVTSQCDRSQPSAKPCCTSLKKLTCKYRDELNQNTDTCATQLFHNLHLKGNYPVGLFNYLCKEGKYGLDCNGY
nr:GPI-anchored protein LLG2-like [Ipomoea batatas]